MTSEQRLESLITRLGEKVSLFSPLDIPPPPHFLESSQSNRSLESNLESLAQVVISEISEFKDKILRTICKWYDRGYCFKLKG